MRHSNSLLFWVNRVGPGFRLNDNVVSRQKLFAHEECRLLFDARWSFVVVKCLRNAIVTALALRLALELIVRVARLWEKVLFAFAKLPAVWWELWRFILRVNPRGKDRRTLSSRWLPGSFRLRFFEHDNSFVRRILWTLALIDWSRYLLQTESSSWDDWIVGVLGAWTWLDLRDVRLVRVDDRLTTLAVDEFVVEHAGVSHLAEVLSKWLQLVFVLRRMVRFALADRGK